MSVKKAALQILKSVKEPLHYKEITKRIIETGLWSSEGKTPEASVRSCLNSDINTYGDQSHFAKVSPGKFSLRNTQNGPDYKTNQPNPRDKCSSDIMKGGYSFLASAEKILEQSRKPMHYKDITEKALKKGLLFTSGRTPEATMNAQLVTELKRTKASGKPARFIRSSPGHFSLVKWMRTDLPSQITTHNKEISKKVLARLKALSPDQFEELVGQLLAEMGFESIEVTKYHNDGGIDVRGTLLIGDVVRIKMAVQAKRWKSNIQIPIVQQVRGSLGAHEQGLIITTSDFSKGAIREANQSDKTPVGLMNGKQLVALLMEYNIGVRRKSHDLFELEELIVAEKENDIKD